MLTSSETFAAAARVLAVEDTLRLALYGAYPEKQGGSAMRLVSPFTFSAPAMSAIDEARKLAQGRGPQPLGEVRARADLVPR